MIVHKVYNRKTRELELEVSGNNTGLNFLYNSLLGKILIFFFNKKKISRLYRIFVRSKWSKYKINSFIKQYNINTSEIKHPVDTFGCLNDFFIRKLRDDVRPIDNEPSHLISPADSRLLIFDLSKQNCLPVKGYWYSLNELICNKNISDEFNDGWCFVYRLAPCDYHRFCYIDNGRQEKIIRIKGLLNSVNPIALSSVKSLLARNYRELSVLHTENFGKVIHIEVGALIVGRIYLHKRDVSSFIKGEEKGWFEFGGSTIIQLFKKQAIVPDIDILENSANGFETIVKIGEKTGKNG